jgi:hypothetical protein
MAEADLNKYRNLDVPHPILKQAMYVSRTANAAYALKNMMRIITYDFPEVPPDQIANLAARALEKAEVRRKYEQKVPE